MNNEEKEKDGATCCLTLPLKLEKWQSDRLEKRFEIGRQIYNTIVHAELKKLRKLERTQQYQEIEQKLENAKQEETKELWKRNDNCWIKMDLAKTTLRRI